MKLGFFLKEALRAMRRNAAPSFAALAAIVVTMVVVGVVIPITQVAQGSANGIRRQVEVDVYMQTSATPAQEARVRGELAAIRDVKRVSFESKAVAYRQQAKSDPAAYALLSGVNPLPDTFHVIPSNPAAALAIRATIDDHGHLLDPAIKTVSNRTSDTRKVLEVTKLVTITAALLAIMLILASIMLVGNTIRLSLYARRREVEVMKLVGATDWFIRWPFVIEGILVGAVGSVVALIILGVMKVALLDPLAGNWSLLRAPSTIPFVWLVVVLIGAGIAVSAIGSGLSLRRFLRV
jgi:cell division transport system permease protein